MALVVDDAVSALDISITLTGAHALEAMVLRLATGTVDIAGAAAIIGTSVPEATFVVHGTQAHDIVAVNKRALFWPGAQHPIKRVHHPGTQPNPFDEQTAAASVLPVAAILERGMQAVIDGVPSAEVGAALASAAQFVKTEMQSRAPVGTGPTAGRLRDSISVVLAGL